MGALALFALGAGASSASAVAPAITDVKVTDIGTESVTLRATVNPEGAKTSYKFEYGPRAADCSAPPRPCVVIASQEDLPASSAPEAIEAPIGGLTPGAAYHFRVAARNGAGSSTTTPYLNFASFLPQAEGLPDGRAYEQASPTRKDGGDLTGPPFYLRASPAGDAITYTSTTGAPGGEGSQTLPAYLAKRNEGGGEAAWSSQGLLPSAGAGQLARVFGWLPDFSETFGYAERFRGPAGVAIFARSSEGGGLTQISPYSKELTQQFFEPSFAAAAPDGSQALFEAKAILPGASPPNAIAERPNLYLWDRQSEQLFLVDVMNDEQPPARGAFAGPYDWAEGTNALSLGRGGASRKYYTQALHAMGKDGSVYFTAIGTGQLYKRVNPTQPQSAKVINGSGEEECTDPAKACTIHVSGSEKTNGGGTDHHDAAGPAPAAFMAASADGSKAFFTSSEKLTDNATTGPEPGPPAIESDTIDGNPANVEADFIPKKAVGLARRGEFIYWATPEAGTIGQAKINGEGKVVEENDEFITDAGTPRYIALDEEFIYWTNTGPLGETGQAQEGKGSIGRAEITGANPNPQFIPGEVETEPGKFKEQITNPQGIAVGPCAGGGQCIYWANAGEQVCLEGKCSTGLQSIGRAPVEGEAGGVIEPKFIRKAGEGGIYDLGGVPNGVALDGSHIYFTADGPPIIHKGKVCRANLDGSAVVTDGETPHSYLCILTTAEAEPDLRQIAVDAGHVYWAEPGAGTVARMPLASFVSSLPPTEPYECGEHAGCEEGWIEADGSPSGVSVDATHIHYSVNGDQPPNPGNDLYRYSAQAGTDGHHLSDLTVDTEAGSPNGAEVLGVLGASEDGSRVYFAANGVLAGGASPGDCKGFPVGGGSGECNLYLWREGAGVSFVAPMNMGKGDAANWAQTIEGFQSFAAQRGSQVSADGKTLLFRSANQLGPYDNKGVPELYLYREGRGAPICVSCDPTDSPPVGAPTLGTLVPPLISPFKPAATLARNLTDEGRRVFFETPDPLAQGDVNGREGCPTVTSNNYPACQDVYEWEEKGTGGCDSEAQGGGCLYLISTGKSKEPAFFADASESGNDVFLMGRESLVRQDTDELIDVYDARVGGGIPSQNATPPEPCESVEACRGQAPPPPPPPPSPGSDSFQGPESPKPVRKKAKKKKHHHKHKKTNKRGASR